MERQQDDNICNAKKLLPHHNDVCHLKALKLIVILNGYHIINGCFSYSHNFFFHSTRLGLPTAVKNCTYSNQTQISVEIHCIAGYDGGLPQYFVLELVSAQTNRVR